MKGIYYELCKTIFENKLYIAKKYCIFAYFYIIILFVEQKHL